MSGLSVLHIPHSITQRVLLLLARRRIFVLLKSLLFPFPLCLLLLSLTGLHGGRTGTLPSGLDYGRSQVS